MLSDLLDQSKIDVVKATEEALRRLLTKEKLATYSLERDPKEGTVTVDGMMFTFSGGHLCLYGYCHNCGQQVPSRPIRRLADIVDLYQNFKPGKHTCADLS